MLLFLLNYTTGNSLVEEVEGIAWLRRRRGGGGQLRRLIDFNVLSVFLIVSKFLLLFFFLPL